MNHGIADEPRAALRYPRHFVALTVMTAILVAVHWRSASLVMSSVVYAALHATSVAVAVFAPATWPLRFLFVVSTVALCAGSVCGSVAVWRYVDASAAVGSVLLLPVVAACGAVGYMALLRTFWMRSLRWPAMLCIPLAAAVASSAAFSFEIKLGRVSGLWIAATWWYTMSCGLCCRDAWTKRFAPR